MARTIKHQRTSYMIYNEVGVAVMRLDVDPVTLMVHVLVFGSGGTAAFDKGAWDELMKLKNEIDLTPAPQPGGPANVN